MNVHFFGPDFGSWSPTLRIALAIGGSLLHSHVRNLIHPLAPAPAALRGEPAGCCVPSLPRSAFGRLAGGWTRQDDRTLTPDAARGLGPRGADDLTHTPQDRRPDRGGVPSGDLAEARRWFEKV